MADPIATDWSQVLAEAGDVITEVLDEWAAHRPEHVFLYDGDRDVRWSYRSAADITARIAGNLQAAGIRKGDRIGVLLDDPGVAVMWMFGIWRAGAVYCPINPMYFGELLSYQVNDTAPELVVTERDLLHRIAEVAGDLQGSWDLVVCDTGSWPSPPEEIVVERTVRGFVLRSGHEFLAPVAFDPPELRFDDTANVIYTSGTTGRSKGVVQSHRWMNQYTWPARQILAEDDVVYSDLPMFHVGGAIFNVARAAWVGATVAVWRKYSSSQFWSRIERSRATTATLMGVMVPWLMNAEPSERDRANTLNKVHMQPLAGNHREVALRFGFDFVATAFGQTEAGVGSYGVLQECKQGEGTPPELYCGFSHDRLAERLEQVGMPLLPGDLPDTQGLTGHLSPLYEGAVHDERGLDVPVGEAGELVLRPRTAGMLADGYLGKPEATVQAWRNLWFHTGDAAYVDERGLWHFVDRMGDRIRRRGENISTQHLEELIGACPGVDLVVAFPVASADNSEHDIAVCVTGEAGLTAERITQWAEDHVPQFMRPQHVVVSESMPTTPTGKIQRFKVRGAFAPSMTTGGHDV